MLELKPCPFCGGTKLRLDSKKISQPRYRGPGKWEDGYTGNVRCNRCHARGPTVTVWVTQHTICRILDLINDAADEAWNRRAGDE